MEFIADGVKSLKAGILGMYKSMTIWVNGIAGTIIILLPMAQDQFPAMQDYLPLNIYHYGMGSLVLLNILLRFKTTTALKDK
jgi:cytochrome b561